MENSNFCDVCKRVLPSGSYDSHVAGKKHMRLNEKMKKMKDGESKLIVRGFPMGTSIQELKNFFNKFEKTTNVHISRSGYTATLQFETKISVDNMISKKIFFKNRHLKLKRWIDINPLTPPIKEETSFVDYSHLIDSLEKAPTYLDEINIIFQEVVESDYDKFVKICEDSEKILKTNGYPKVVIHPFGSVITSLALKQSDIDFYVELNAPEINDQLKCPVNVIKKIFYTQKQIFKNIVAIPKSKVPLVKCTHISTKTNCDFSFKNAFGVRNSSLIQFLVTLDGRIRILIILIKIWGKIQDITGIGKISNYALVMIICFYLQNLKEPIIPKFCQLQALASKPDIIEDWDFSFTDNASLLPPITNRQTIRELLLGFFEFYSNFDFKTKIISLIKGETVKKQSLSKPDNIPEGLERLKTYYLNKEKPSYFKEGPISVQDPFVLNQNLTHSANEYYVESFQRRCKKAMEFISKSKDNEPFLGRLYYMSSLYPNDKQAESYLQDIRQYKSLVSSEKQEDELKALFKYIVDLALSVHTEIFNTVKRSECHIETCSSTEDNFPKNYKFDTNDYLFECKVKIFGTQIFTMNRNKIRKTLQKQLENKTTFEQEKIITKYMVDTNNCLKDNYELLLNTYLCKNYKFKMIYTNLRRSDKGGRIRLTCTLAMNIMKKCLQESLEQLKLKKK